MLPQFPATEKEDLFKDILELIVASALPFSFIETPELHRVLNRVRPGVSSVLVGRTVISKRVLNERYKEAVANRDKRIDEVSKSGHFLGLIVDGWETNGRKTLKGVMLKAGPNAFLLTTHVPGSTHHGLAVAKMWEEIMDKPAQEYKDRVRFFLSDDAGQCARARRILALRHPHLIWIKCWAHQVNLIVGQLMNKGFFAKVCNDAVKSASAVKSSSSKWYKRLRDTAERYYGKKVPTTVLTLADTRWNSLQGCFASLLRIRKACRATILENEHDPKLPDALRVWENNAFWKELEDAELLVRPLCDASFLMQREGNTLAHVLVMLVNVYKGIAEYHGETLDGAEENPVVADVAKRWELAEQPLFVLCFCVHPSFYTVAVKMLQESEARRGKWMNSKNPLTCTRLVTAAIYYYKKHELWMGEVGESKEMEIMALRKEMFRWLKGNAPMWKTIAYSVTDYKHPGLWFDENEDFVGTKLANFARFLLDCPAQGASCERLFKHFARFLTKARNRLSTDKLMKSTMIKYDMTSKYQGDTSFGNANRALLHRNRYVKPDEHSRVDTQLAEEDQQGTIQGQERAQGQESLETTGDNLAGEEDNEDYMVDEEDTIPPEYEMGIPPEYDHPQLRAILAAIQASSAETEDLYDAMDDGDEDEEGKEEDSLVQAEIQAVGMERRMELEALRERELEEASETPPARKTVLDPLPTNDDKLYPQENEAYFRKKENQSVRTDKYKLEHLFVDGFPSIMDCFEGSERKKEERMKGK